MQIKQITSLRFIIAFVIFLFHAKFYYNISFGNVFFDAFISNSATFMSGFFVLSGYIIYEIYHKNDFSQIQNVKNFYIKRFAKIYPSYFLISFVYTLFLVFTLKENLSFKEWVLYIINGIFLLQAFSKELCDLLFHQNTWSISVEAFFYFTFPFVMVFEKFIKGKKLFYISLSFLFLININVLFSLPQNETFSFYVNPFCSIFEFLTGIAFCKMKKEGDLQNFALIFKNINFLIIAIFINTLSLLSSGLFEYGGMILANTCLFAFLIYVVENSKAKFLSSKPLVFMGNISYCFFLLQSFSFNLVKLLEIPPFYAVLTTFALNTLLAFLCTKFFEEPLKNYIIQRNCH